jgi:hypothetical protein
LYPPAWDSNRYSVVQNVSDDYRSGSDSAILTDFYSGQNNRAGPDETITSNGRPTSDDRAWANMRKRSDECIVLNYGGRIYNYVVTYDRIALNHCVCSDQHAFADQR